ncbi:hypothetical protein [Mycobacterium sp. ST-F2]|uniref:hypothetical protein n=1 Tax=Mycobacterium sp. ST-F2 TaxID=1490484 RepID=UPI001154C97C|nr:hypothetical protein [Mycobacterium sp. ST-F2]
MTAVEKPSAPPQDADATDLVAAQNARTAEAVRLAAEARKALGDTDASGPIPTITDIVQITLGIQPEPTTPATQDSRGRGATETPPTPQGGGR